MANQPHSISFCLPEWIEGYCDQYHTTQDIHARMRFVIGAAKENVRLNTGGPFAAAVFEIETGELVSLGVNLVPTEAMSILHAEMVAISVAQRKLSTYDLGEDAQCPLELVSSTEPCAMCLGAIPWSGVRRVVTGARDTDARDIGFDEGPKPEDWISALTSRGIQVLDRIEQESAAEVLIQYGQQNGHIYNSRKG